MDDASMNRLHRHINIILDLAYNADKYEEAPYEHINKSINMGYKVFSLYMIESAKEIIELETECLKASAECNFYKQYYEKTYPIIGDVYEFDCEEINKIKQFIENILEDRTNETSNDKKEK